MRDLAGHVQGMLLADGKTVSGRTVFGARWDHADRFVLMAIRAGAEEATGVNDFMAKSESGDYLVAVRESTIQPWFRCGAMRAMSFISDATDTVRQDAPRIPAAAGRVLTRIRGEPGDTHSRQGRRPAVPNCGLTPMTTMSNVATRASVTVAGPVRAACASVMSTRAISATAAAFTP